tara:strand:- start:129 stop:1205 length:1077 start_codon:yes stop_codon:yes gene_type:complete
MKLINYIKHIENFCINFKPKKNKILVYDALSLKFAKNLFSNFSMTVFHTRYEGVSIYILFKTLLENGFKNFKNNYKKTFFSFVSPKIIFSAIDNNISFFKLKSLYPIATYITDQNGMRDNKFYIECRKYLRKKKSNKLISDYFFCFGQNEKKRLKKIIWGRIYPYGKTLNNVYKYSKVKKFKLKKIIFISSLNTNIFPKDLKAFKNLVEICKRKNLKLYFLDRRKSNNLDFLKKNVASDSFKYLINSKFDQKKNKFFENTIFLFSHSTLGYELLSRGHRVGCFNNNHIEHFIEKKYPISGNFWENSIIKESLEKLIFKIENYNQIEWNRIVKKYSKDILIYDKNNNLKKKIIKKILSK